MSFSENSDGAGCRGGRNGEGLCVLLCVPGRLPNVHFLSKNDTITTEAHGRGREPRNRTERGGPTPCFWVHRLRATLWWAIFLCCAGCGGEQERAAPAPVALSPMPAGRIAWRAWAARDSARVLDRPLFLYLYSSRSFWCREMVRRCFDEDAELAGEIMRGTFPIRVDVDRRPDLAERFGMGGWPSTVFLTPEGAWITGSTYLDPSDLQRLLRRVRIYFDNPDRRADLERERRNLEKRLDREARSRPRPRLRPSRALLDRLADSVRVAIARGESPGPEALLLLLEQDGAEAAALAALDRLAPLQDRDGGFFLAALTPDGAVVDREKPLATSAGWLAAYARAAQRAGRAEDRAVATGLGEALLAGFARPDSVFAAGFAGFTEGEVAPRDPAVYTCWNALAISGFVELYGLTEAAGHLEAARRTFEALRRRMARAGGGFGHFEGAAEAPLMLADQALLARAALDLYAVEGREADLHFAQGLADLMLARFREGPGALDDRAPEPGQPEPPAADRLVPSGNGVAAQVLARLYGHTGRAAYRTAAGEILTSLAGPHIDRAADMGALGRGLRLYLERE